MYHIANFHISKYIETHTRHHLAYLTWCDQYKHGLIPKYTFDYQFDRNSSEIGGTRNLPYVNDIIDIGIMGLNDDDIVVYGNIDICFLPNFSKNIESAVREHGGVYSPRIEVGDVLDIDISQYQHMKYGSDVFAFTVKFWKNIRKQYPLYFVGCSCWDTILICLIMKYGGKCVYNTNYHRMHTSSWAGINVENVYNLKNYYSKVLELFEYLPDDGTDRQQRRKWYTSQAIKTS
jgi:hypothetical protein